MFQTPSGCPPAQGVEHIIPFVAKLNGGRLLVDYVCLAVEDLNLYPA